MAGYNNPMLSDGTTPMRPWRGAGSDCGHGEGEVGQNRELKRDTSRQASVGGVV